VPGKLVVDKPGKGAFHATDLDAMLKNRGITQLIVCGVTTEVCVNTTVREADDRGYEYVVLRRLLFSGISGDGATHDQGARLHLRMGCFIRGGHRSTSEIRLVRRRR